MVSQQTNNPACAKIILIAMDLLTELLPIPLIPYNSILLLLFPSETSLPIYFSSDIYSIIG